MRSLWGLAITLFAACTDTGAHLTFSAPTGPDKVTSFEIVLATQDHVAAVPQQRMAPSSLETQTVAYYRQRTIAGGTHGKIEAVDGFAVRVEPDPAVAEREFIPFVLMYEGDRIVAVATFRHDDSVDPAAILVQSDVIDKYILDVEPVEQVADLDPAAAGQARVIDCAHADDTTFTSGIVWRPQSGGEIRLLFPDDGGDHATERTLDLDCDGHAVSTDSSGEDCDDTREWFHHDAQDSCDGYDTNCDGRQNLVVACSDGNVCPDPATGQGIAVCDDRTNTQSSCVSDPQCACAGEPTECTRCIVETDLGASAGAVKPCQPGIGYVKLPSCTDSLRCRVDVLSAGGGWKAEVSPDVQPYTFGSAAQGLGAKVVLRVKRPEGPTAEIGGTLGASTGDVVLRVQNADGTVRVQTLDLQLASNLAACAGTGPYSMTCFP